MRQTSLIRTIINLSSFGALAKFLSVLARIITIRLFSEEVIGLNALSTSSLVLLVTLVQLGLPGIIARQIAQTPQKRVRILATAFLIITAITLVMMLLILIGAPYFAERVLKNPDTKLSLYGLIPLVPLYGYGAIIKADFVGTNRVSNTAEAQISEEVMRILFILIIGFTLSNQPAAVLAGGLMLALSAGEIASITHLLVLSRRQWQRKLKTLRQEIKHPEPTQITALLFPAVALTSGRLIGALTFFVEPIILTNLLMRQGFDATSIAKNYAALTSLAMPLMLLPGFFTSAFANAMLPVIARDYQRHYNDHAARVARNLTLASFLIGLAFALLAFFLPTQLMQFVYGTSRGSEYIRLIAFPFILYYIQAPLSMALLAINQEKRALRDTIIGAICRVILMLLLIPKLHYTGLAIATIINVFIVTLLHALTLINAYRAVKHKGRPAQANTEKSAPVPDNLPG